MRLNHAEFVQHVVDDTVEAARHDYAAAGRELFREGAIAGAEACRNLDADGIAELLIEAGEAARTARATKDPRYWYFRCFEVEVGWVANVLSAAMDAAGLPPIAEFTARGRLKAAEILNPPSDLPRP